MNKNINAKSDSLSVFFLQILLVPTKSFANAQESCPSQYDSSLVVGWRLKSRE